MRIGSLFSGAGGLDLAVEEVFGGQTIWQSEVNKAASVVLEKRFGVPNLGDITQINWHEVPTVDILCGGFPCQDVSAAGLRQGITEGTRSGLWSYFAEAIDILRPQYVVIENVRGLLSAKAKDAQGVSMRAMGRVLGDLADLGYDARWKTLAAGSVGAPHKRERVFILATPADTSRD
ncbi:DNA methylase [Mycobacterium phage GaugeLDP]|nr:DNA methylase [Mycobacterium phage GaugeLDP]